VSNGERAQIDARSAGAAMAACLLMLAAHVGSKAVRDAFFLSQFPITALPAMVIGGAVFSIATVAAASRAMSRFTPARLVPASFAASAGLFVLVWFVTPHYPRAAAVVLYLQTVGIGALLTSGFWSVVNERFDPHRTRQLVSRIAGAGTLGGMIGGIIAERIAAHYTLSALIPILACYHLACFVLLMAVRTVSHVQESREEPAPDAVSALQILREVPYLRTVAALVILGTMSAAMLDFAFKAQAVAEYGKGATLLRFFAAFHTVTGVLTFLVQAGLGEFALAQLGMARTVAALPMAVSIGGLGALALPGLGTIMIARGIESVFRGSLFRAGYELFYAPVPNREKRAAKSTIDVGFDRGGDALGGVVVSLLLFLGPAVSHYAAITGAILVSLAGLWIAGRLQGAYIDALEHGLRERGGELPSENLDNSLALTGFADMTLVGPSALGSSSPSISIVGPAAAPAAAHDAGKTTASAASTPPGTVPVPSAITDPVVQQIVQLRSGSATSVRQVLVQSPEPRPPLIPHLIQLLAWDRVANEVIRSLRGVAARHTGQLIDALLDPSSDFAVRRRVPRVLTAVPSERAARALLEALHDRRFEVRFQCGRALAIIQARNPAIRFNEEEVLGALRREVAVSKPVWDSHRLLDRNEEGDTSPGDETPLVGELLRDRTNRSLQHLFTLLSLVFPAEPLTIALHGLHTDDPYLRGTAIEYLESILPPDIRDRLRPLIAGFEGRRSGGTRLPEQVVADLVKSNQSIVAKLADLRRKTDEDPGTVF
jgi:hypothetical protein